MSPRSIRRAAEREAEKLARKAEKLSLHSNADAATEPSAAPSEARLLANRSNAQLSTGPRTIEGKTKSSFNAVKTGLTGRTVLLPTEDAAAYEQHVQDCAAEFRPSGSYEAALVQSIADTAWRLRRIPELEMGIYALGHDEQLAEHAAAGNESPDTHFFELNTFLKYEKQLRNLQLQESRLRRHREKDMAELRALQAERCAKEKEQAEAAAEARKSPATPTQHNGFVFSNQPQTERDHPAAAAVAAAAAIAGDSAPMRN